MDNTEKQINDMLRKTLIISQMYEKQGKHELATAILRLGSVIAERALILNGITAHETKYNLCPTCKRKYRDWNNRESIIKGYECLSCSHIRPDIN